MGGSRFQRRAQRQNFHASENPTKAQVLQAVPCSKCGARRGQQCDDGQRASNHFERMHLAQLLFNAYRKSGEEVERVKDAPRPQRTLFREPDDFDVIDYDDNFAKSHMREMAMGARNSR